MALGGLDRLDRRGGDLVDPAWLAGEPALAGATGPHRGGRAGDGPYRGPGRRRLRPPVAGTGNAALSGSAQRQRLGAVQPALHPAYDHADLVQLLPDRRVLWLRRLD